MIHHHDDRDIGKGALLVSVKEFQTHYLHISEVLKDSGVNHSNEWTVSAAFNPLRYIEDSQFFEGALLRV